ncbi:MAG: hypothetical protein HY245_13100 [Rhizobiales bacterium]|nr:hypothetical protein [Hyphomicrobiales bacterium]MBI3674327.1 hypothetical protein [Hyphomicrobiales bacterium]
MKKLLIAAAALAAMSATAFAVSANDQHRPRGNNHDVDALTSCPSGVKNKLGFCETSPAAVVAMPSYRGHTQSTSAFDAMTANQNSHNQMP